jgi:hypothetical protein
MFISQILFQIALISISFLQKADLLGEVVSLALKSYDLLVFVVQLVL